MTYEIVMQRVSCDMSFEDWLLRNFGYTSERLQELALASGTVTDYRRAYSWYLNRYTREIQFLRDVQQLNINDFLKNGGLNNDGINE